MVYRSSSTSWRRSLLGCLVGAGAVLLLCLAGPSTANPTNPVFIQRDLPPAPPYAFGFEDADSSEEVTIVKRSGGRGESTFLTTTQAEPVAVTNDGSVNDGDKEQQQSTKSKTTMVTASTSAGPRPGKKDSAAGKAGTSSGGSTPAMLDSDSDSRNGGMAPRPEDMPQRIELANNMIITRPHKRNVYDTYTGEASETGHSSCSCGGYMLVEKKIYACEPKETVVRLMKRSPNHDDCIAQETQHVGVVQMPDGDHEESFQLVPLAEDAV
uniref:Putative secreted protein n=2 Tax=Anopheles marajoara TaxID=58244 RepID=A0A2M4BWU3_9DIPT